ncbi:MAG: hypothetical protein WB689_21590, partial [Xanthobacteraceae bacterium]
MERPLFVAVILCLQCILLGVGKGMAQDVAVVTVQIGVAKSPQTFCCHGSRFRASNVAGSEKYPADQAQNSINNAGVYMFLLHRINPKCMPILILGHLMDHNLRAAEVRDRSDCWRKGG